MNTSSSRYHRAPTGVMTARPVGLRLLPDEHRKLKETALTEGRSMASQARIWMVRGMEAEAPATTTATALS